jgi:hypothetical protein
MDRVSEEQGLPIVHVNEIALAGAFTVGRGPVTAADLAVSHMQARAAARKS